MEQVAVKAIISNGSAEDAAIVEVVDFSNDLKMADTATTAQPPVQPVAPAVENTPEPHNDSASTTSVVAAATGATASKRPSKKTTFAGDANAEGKPLKKTNNKKPITPAAPSPAAAPSPVDFEKGKGPAGKGEKENCCNRCVGNLAAVTKGLVLIILSAVSLGALAIACFYYAKQGRTCANDLWPAAAALGVALAAVFVFVLIDTLIQTTGEKNDESSPFRRVWESLNLTLLSFGFVTAMLAWACYELLSGGLGSNMWQAAIKNTPGAPAAACDATLWKTTAGVCAALVVFYVLYLVPFLILAFVNCCCTRFCVTKGTCGEKSWISALRFYGVKEAWYDASRLRDPAVEEEEKLKKEKAKAEKAEKEKEKKEAASSAVGDAKKQEDAAGAGDSKAPAASVKLVKSTKKPLSPTTEKDDDDDDEETGVGAADEDDASAQSKPLRRPSLKAMSAVALGKQS